MDRSLRFILWPVLLFIAGCLGFNDPPFPGKPPERAVYGTPPPTVHPEVWFGDVKNWGAESYFYHSPHFQGNFFRQQAGVSTTYGGRNLRQIAFLSDIDPAFSNYIDPAEAEVQEQLVQEAYAACIAQEIAFYYSIPFPLFPVQDSALVKKVHPELFRPDGTLDLGHPTLATEIRQAIQAFKAAMPEMKGVSIVLEEGGQTAFPIVRRHLSDLSSWLPALLQAVNESCRELGLKGVVSIENIWHTNLSRRQAYQIFNQFPDLSILEHATWPEETTLMPFWGFIPPVDTPLLQQNPMAVRFLTDTEYLGQGKIPVVLPRWWQNMAQQAYLHEVDIAMCRAFQGDDGGTATNFNRLNLQLLLHFLQEPRAGLKAALQTANEEMFGDDFPTRLTSIMIITEDAIQAITGVNYVNVLDHAQFPRPQYLDRDYLRPPHTYKAVDDLFEPPGTPLYTEDVPQPDTLDAGAHWRWQTEISAQPVDQYLLDIENAINWLESIQKEVDYLTLEFPARHRALFVDGYRDLLLLGRGLYQFVQGAAVHHRWYRLERISQEEARQQLAPIAAQLRLIANEANDSSLDLRQRMLQMAIAFENLEILKTSD